MARTLLLFSFLKIFTEKNSFARTLFSKSILHIFIVILAGKLLFFSFLYRLLLNKTDCDLLVENVSHFANTNPNESFFDQITKFGLGTVTIGAINLVMAYIFVTCLNHAAECQVHRIRGLFFKSVLRQDIGNKKFVKFCLQFDKIFRTFAPKLPDSAELDPVFIGWYDTHQTGDFAVKMAEDLNKIQEGIGEKIGMFIFFMTICLCSISNAFYHGWELTLVMIAAMPLLMIAVAIIAGSQTALTEKEANAYGRAGAIADEVLSSIRTVVAFGGQDKEVERYESKLIYAKKAGLLRGILTGVGGMFTFLHSGVRLKKRALPAKIQNKNFIFRRIYVVDYLLQLCLGILVWGQVDHG